VSENRYICTPFDAEKIFEIMTAQKKLTNLQLELLQVFSRELPEEQLLEIRQLLAKYFAQKVDEEMDSLWQERGWTEETMRQWAT